MENRTLSLHVFVYETDENLVYDAFIIRVDLDDLSKYNGCDSKSWVEQVFDKHFDWTTYFYQFDESKYAYIINKICDELNISH